MENYYSREMSDETTENLVILTERVQCLIKLFQGPGLTDNEKKILINLINELVYNIKAEIINCF